MKSSFLYFCCYLIVSCRSAFVPTQPRLQNNHIAWSPITIPASLEPEMYPIAVQRQRRSVAPIQTQGLFGLGLPEIGVILIAVAFLLGPKELGNLARTSVSRAAELKEELKEVPKEFQKGLEEGEIEARSRKARRIKVVPKEDGKQQND